MSASFTRTLAALALAAPLAACSSGASLAPTLPAPAQNVGGVRGGGLTDRIVGVGDSLTAGVQSNGLLGVTVAPNPLYPAGSLFPVVPATQLVGYYADVWAQATGGNPSDPNGPLPLIKAPGVGQILIPNATGTGLTSITTACGDLNALAFSPATALQTRVAPQTTPLDVAVPGQTMHEALYQTGPTGPCDGSALPAPFNGLNQIVNAENRYYGPILGSFGPGATQIGAALADRPTLALVWLGSNDLLKFLTSNGGFPPAPADAFAADADAVVGRLTAAGAKVAIANLLDVEKAPYFVGVAQLPTLFTAGAGLPAATATPLAASLQAYLQQTYGLGNGALLQLAGWNKILGALPAIAGGTPISAALSAAGFGAPGDYTSDTVAAQAEALLGAYNAAIARGAAQHGGATLVDIHGFYDAIVAGSYGAPGFYALPGNSRCCSVRYRGGFISLDGFHPSATGYALLANQFIAVIDASLGGQIPPLSTAQLTAINAGDLYSPR